MISAPGKVLLLGGYAVLDGYPALSVAVTDAKGMGACASCTKSPGHRLVSKEFGIDAALDPKSPLSALRGAEKTHRVALSAYATVLSYFRHIGHTPEPLEAVLGNSPVFGGKDEKSGLGSSAAATVALTAALLDGNGFDIDKHREQIHKLAQISHALATEKTGSGFDVATSTFGTIEYVRFDKNLLNMNSGMGEDEFSGAVGELLKTDWPRLIVKKAGTGKFGMLAFNIKGGKTSTISSVKAVRKLTEHAPELYANMISGQVAGERKVFAGISKGESSLVREGMHEARRFQRLLSGWVGRIGMMNFDPIEPPALTSLIDRAEQLPGIVAGRCPGSGGYDSVVFVTEGGPAQAVEIAKIGKSLALNLEHLELEPSSEGVRKA
ncbi:MAG TPA: hypothetical protein VLD37_03435 [Candidatus Bilamarchaeum sp.]|nr:hypothetical protein [Candidatus Bilamarchaeum sp.]